MKPDCQFWKAVIRTLTEECSPGVPGAASASHLCVHLELLKFRALLRCQDALDFSVGTLHRVMNLLP